MGGSAISSSSMRSYYDKMSSEWDHATNCKQVFKERRMVKEFDPSQMKLPREVCDSAESPHSRGIIFAEDVTGSMGSFIMNLITKQFPRLIEQTYKKVSYNPHICFMGVGDAAVDDEAPLQVTQFETDLRMLDQLQKIFIEEGGGGNNYESYILPWYFAAKHVRMDGWEKRKEKGFLFTFGDEEPTPKITKNEIKKVFGDNDSIQQNAVIAKECLEMASEKFNCYHIILPGSYYRYYSDRVIEGWSRLMGSHALVLEEYEYLPELVTAILSMYEGYSKTDVINNIQDKKAKEAVASALCNHEEYVENESDESTDETAEIDLF